MPSGDVIFFVFSIYYVTIEVGLEDFHGTCAAATAAC